LISFHSGFAPPYVHYSIIPANRDRSGKAPPLEPTRILTAPVAGVSSAKMMHDFGVSRLYTVIMDLPLTLDPLNIFKNKAVVSYDPTARSRYGVFPRYQPDNVRWFETNACCIFHTANTWETVERMKRSRKPETLVHMLACRLTSASLVFSAGDLTAPVPSAEIPSEFQEEEQCRLYYYQFPMDGPAIIRHQWALSAVSFEFPSMRESLSMSKAKYIYGCSADTSFGAALGKAAKIDSLVKMDIETLIERGLRNPPTQVKGCVDARSIEEILESNDPKDPIQIFRLPPNYYAQEPRFVPRENGVSEDDGWLVSYVFDENQLEINGDCKSGAKSELWIIDAKNMKDVVAKVQLPQRVPYGLHGTWFSEEEIKSQRPIESIRQFPSSKPLTNSVTTESYAWKTWLVIRGLFEAALA
jgi:carotenoid cleavage dioxygenase-like enzyme